jgi:hypothetical protein
MSWVEKLKQYGVDEAEFNKFCGNYPQFASNRELMAKLYLSVVKGVRVAEPRVTGEFTSISELSVGEVSRIQVAVVQQVEKRAYVGCPKCMRKLQAAPNTTVECQRDGIVRAQLLEWNLVLAGDSTGEIMLSIPPSVGRVPNVGEVIAVEGVLTEQEEFLVYRFSAVETKTVEEKVETKAVAVPSPAVEQPAVEVTEYKCKVCGKTFKNTQALKIHEKLAHKETAKSVEATKPVETETKVEAKPEPVPTVAEAKTTTSIPEEAVKLARVAAVINKPLEEFKAYILGKYPGINIDELLKTAGCVVEGEVLKKVG